MPRTATLLGIFSCVSPAYANVILIQDNRLIAADTRLTLDLNEPGGPVTDEDHAEFVPGFGNSMNNQVASMLEGVNAGQTIQTMSQATQSSSISANTLHAALSVEADVFGSAHSFIPGASAISTFDVTFTLSRQMDYTFELLNISGMNFDPANPHHARLIDSGGNLISGFFEEGSNSGTLDAGDYRMVVETFIAYETDHQFRPSKSIEASLSFIPTPSSMTILGISGVAAIRRRRC